MHYIFCFTVVLDVYRDSWVSLVIYISSHYFLPLFGCSQGFSTSMCIFDAVCLRQGKVWLIDLNPFGEVTDSLLFTWEELTSGNSLSANQEEGETAQQVSDKYVTQAVALLCICMCMFVHVCKSFCAYYPVNTSLWYVCICRKALC